MARKSSSTVHYTRGGKRVLCGLLAKATSKDTRVKARVSCKNCLRVLKAEARD